MRTKTMAGQRHYGWVIFGLSFTNLLVEGGIKNTVPVVYVALRDSFHWSAAATSGVFSLGGSTGALCAPLLGRLLDRLGPRWLFPLGGLLVLLGYLTSSSASELWHLYLLYGILATVGESSISSFTTAAILSPWFPRHRGRMSGPCGCRQLSGAGRLPPTGPVAHLRDRLAGHLSHLGVLFSCLVGPANFFLQRRPPIVQAAARAVKPLREQGSVFPGGEGGWWYSPLQIRIRVTDRQRLQRRYFAIPPCGSWSWPDCWPLWGTT